MKRVMLALVLTASTAASADTLLLSAAEAALETAQARPATGNTMETVHTRFGQPERRLGPVGEPPITRWVYPEFTVFFEHDRVINTVPRR